MDTVPNSTQEPEIGEILQLDREGTTKSFLKRKKWLIAAALAAAAVIAFALFSGGGKEGVSYVTEPVEKGDLVITVSATGTLEPVNEVEVGTEVSGTIEKVFVETNDEVEAGDMLARLETSRLELQVLQARANLAVAKARVVEAEATSSESETTLKRTKHLAERGFSSQESLDAAQAARDRSASALAVANAQVEVAEADLSLAETSLTKADIRSPIHGIVLERQVDPGQTVAASLQTPLLFKLAEDLKDMELHVDLDEADVGKVSPGQTASFTVDAYPDRQFPAKTMKVQFAPSTAEGVVTYETDLSVDNSEMLLRPGMTATAVITVSEVHDALLVPNQALRFTPPRTEKKAGGNGGLVSQILPHMPRRSQGTRSNGDQKKVWVLRKNELVGIAVMTGPSDGRMTQIVSGDLKAGDPVIVDTEQKK